jgi:hypothetical protein
LLTPVVSPLGKVPLDPDVVGLACAVADGLPLPDGETAALAECAGVIAGLVEVLRQFVGAVLAVSSMRALVEVAAVALWLALAVVVGLALVVTPELGVAVPLGLPPDEGGVVGGVVGGTSGDVVGVTLLLGETAGLTAAELLGGHMVAAGLVGVADVLPCPSAPTEVPLTTPPDELAGLVVPLLLLLLLCCCEESPTELPRETKAARSGGSDSATPIANTAQATATTGRIMRSRRSAGDRVCPLLRCSFVLSPGRPEAAAPCASAPAAGIPPSRDLRRRIQPASPGFLAGASAPSLVKAVPARTRARMRSRPSGRGST